MKANKLLAELESLVEQVGYTIRKERGTFRGDSCIVEGDKLVVINKNQPVEMQVGICTRVLHNRKIEDIYIKPAIRKHLEELWDRFDQFDEAQQEDIDIDDI